MVMMEGRNGIHADAGFGEARRDRRQEADRIECGVNRQADQARGKRIVQSRGFCFSAQDYQRCAFLLAKRQQWVDRRRNAVICRDRAEHEDARPQLRPHVSQQHLEIAFTRHHSGAFSGPS
jgi:hypothetical protein